MDIFPVLIILPVLQYGKIDSRIFLTDFGKTRVISAVSAHINLLRGSFNKERSPKRLIGFQETSGEMTGRQAVNKKALIEPGIFKPVQFHQTRLVEAPIFKMLAHPQRTNDLTRTLLQLHHRAVVQMVPMVVRDNQVINVGHIFRLVNIRTLKRLVKERKRGGRTENGVYQYPLAVRLDKIRRMAEPHQHILVPSYAFQVRLDGRNIFLWTKPFLFFENKTP